jgi:hypothetical protein
MSIDRIRSRSLFILGVQKAGTTSLHDLLGQHPDIAAAEPKEPNHYIKRAVDWPMVLASGPVAMPTLPYFTDGDYAAIFENGGPQASYYLDSSTGYFPYNEALDAIAQTCIEPRVIVVLREPVSRAYSAFNWARKVGWEPLDRFEDALAAEPGRREQGYWFSYHYANHSRYAGRVAAVQERFPHRRFVLFDDLKSDPQRVCRELFDWLGLPAAPIEVVQSNRSGIDRGTLRRRLRALVTQRRDQQGTVAGLVRKILPVGLLRWVKRRITSRLDAEVVAPDRLSPDLRARLAASFADDIAATEKLIGRDLSAWTRS